MVLYHGYGAAEIAKATKLSVPDVKSRLERLGLAGKSARNDAGALAAKAGRLLVLPYPGGRHPRIGFLDGAINPRRDTKASVFLPWKGGGYVVADLPEAVFSGRDLIFLAHTHIPTVWDKKGVKIPWGEWKVSRGPGQASPETLELSNNHRLPDGVEIRARVIPRRDAVDMELVLKNGSKRKLAKSRSQVCIMLKGAPHFAAQTNENKILGEGYAAVHSTDKKRWIVVTWKGGRAWANPPCPCLHADPVFPALDPGGETCSRGRLFFYAGDDVKKEIERRRAAGTLFAECAGK